MKNLSIAAALISCVAISGVSGVAAQKRKKRSGQPQHSASSKSQGIRAEAEARAAKLTDQFFTRCGDSYYAYFSGVEEWRGLHLLMEHHPPSMADKLNGLEWDTRVKFNFDVQWRNGSWSDSTDMVCLELTKVHGAWNLDACFEDQRRYFAGFPPKQKLTCGEIARPR